MSLADDLHAEVGAIFKATWATKDGRVVPDTEKIGLGNQAIKIWGSVLYADMADSTTLVDAQKPHFAAEVYKGFLHVAARVIRAEGGDITAYDGDRIMAVFVGGQADISSVRAALKINYARSNIVNPAIKAQYPSQTYQVQHVVGIDSSELWVAKTGVRGANDLVWVGGAANHAAKLASLPPTHQTRITAVVYQSLDNSTKFYQGKSMWEKVTWNAMTGQAIYRSKWGWKI